MSRVFHHYERLEEYQDGMWRITRGEKRKAHVAASASLMRDPAAFQSAMFAALEQWPLSCEHNLTAENVNRIAWLGHAGCCVGVSSPEDCTRLGWHTLTREEQDEANRVAAEVLKQWDEARSPDLFSRVQNGS